MKDTSSARKMYEESLMRRRAANLKSDAWKQIYKYLFDFKKGYFGTIEVDKLNLGFSCRCYNVPSVEGQTRYQTDKKQRNIELITEFFFKDSKIRITERDGSEVVFNLELQADCPPETYYNSTLKTVGYYSNKEEVFVTSMIKNWAHVKETFEEARKAHDEQNNERRKWERSVLKNELNYLENFKI